MSIFKAKEIKLMTGVSNPASGFIKTYPTTVGKMVVKDSAGVERQLGFLDNGTAAGQIAYWDAANGKYIPLANADGYLKNTSGVLSWSAVSGGIGGSIANTQVAFGNNTDIAGSNNFVWDNTNKSLSVKGFSNDGSSTTFYSLNSDGAIRARLYDNGNFILGNVGSRHLYYWQGGGLDKMDFLAPAGKEAGFIMDSDFSYLSLRYQGAEKIFFGGAASTQYLDISNNLLIRNTTDKVAILTINSTTRVSTFTAKPGNDTLYIKAGGTTGTTIPLYITNSSDSAIFSIKDNGEIIGSAINVNISSNYGIKLGYTAGTNITGTRNVTIGYNAGTSVSSSNISDNVYIGSYAGENSTTGANYNVAVGYLALRGYGASPYFTGTSNIVMGYYAGTSMTSGSRNALFGSSAGTAITSGTDNVVIGYSAGDRMSSSSNNILFGLVAGRIITTGGENIFIGYYSGSDGSFSLTGSRNIGMGHSSLARVNGAAINNIAIGFGSMAGSVSNGIVSSENIGIGTASLAGIYTGDSNIAIGNFSGNAMSTGSRNTFIGAGTGQLMTTGTDNVFIGYQVGYNENGSNKLYIDNTNTSTPLIYGEFDNNLLRVNGILDVTTGYKINNVAGVSGTWTTVDGKTITATNGIITSIV